MKNSKRPELENMLVEQKAKLDKMALQLLLATRDALDFGVGILIVDKNSGVKYVDLEEAKELLEKVQLEA